MSLAHSAEFAGVLFDKDGTLIDFQRTWGPALYAVIHALAAQDPALITAQAQALHYSIENKSFLPSSPLVSGSTADYGQLWAGALGRSDFDALRSEIDALSAEESLRSLTPIANPPAVFSALRDIGLRIGIATNDSERSARRQIKALAVAHYVDFVAGYDSGHGGKPEPGMVVAFAEFIGASASRVAVVGDSLHDLAAAKAAGATAIAVLTGPACRSALEPCADYIIEHIGHLPNLMMTLNRL